MFAQHRKVVAPSYHSRSWEKNKECFFSSCHCLPDNDINLALSHLICHVPLKGETPRGSMRSRRRLTQTTVWPSLRRGSGANVTSAPTTKETCALRVGSSDRKPATLSVTLARVVSSGRTLSFSFAFVMDLNVTFTALDWFDLGTRHTFRVKYRSICDFFHLFFFFFVLPWWKIEL